MTLARGATGFGAAASDALSSTALHGLTFFFVGRLAREPYKWTGANRKRRVAKYRPCCPRSSPSSLPKFHIHYYTHG